MIRIFGLSILMLICIYLVYAYPQIAQKNTDLETNATLLEDLESHQDILETIIPELEYLHEEQLDRVVDGYIVETYREYEFYRDKAGNIIKQVPTSNYEYIRYKDY